MAVASPLPASPSPGEKPPAAERLQALGGLAQRTKPTALAREQILPVVPELASLFPGRGVRRGSTVAIAAGTGATSLALAFLAGPSSAGSWCAAVGLPSLGLVAAAEAGIDLARLALVAWPGNEWAAVAAAFVDSLDVVVVQPPGSVKAGDARRLSARARERRAVLVPLGDWPQADVRLEVTRSRWEGLGAGHGHLTRRRLEVMSGGRGEAAGSRRARLWLPRS
ncbi:MAG: hypothetical protein QOG03_610 [Actinomycetota bacterium]|nr:hypothetical protein [Actinomycetota bacterium]